LGTPKVGASLSAEHKLEGSLGSWVL
jgi:hypothetical protein